MTAPLAVCTKLKEEQRSVIRFLSSESVTGAEIYHRLSENALLRRSVYEWIESFRAVRTNVKQKKENDNHQSPQVMKKEAQEMILKKNRSVHR